MAQLLEGSSYVWRSPGIPRPSPRDKAPARFVTMGKEEAFPMKIAFKICKETVNEFFEDKCMRLGAALAFYSIFSIAPILLIIISVVGLIYGPEAVKGELDKQIEGAVGSESARVIQSMLASTAKKENSCLAVAIGTATLLLGASGVFGQLKDALNTVWNIRLKPKRGWKGLLKDRFLSFTMILVTGFLLLSAMAISTALSAASKLPGFAMPIPGETWKILDLSTSIVVVTVLFAMIFKILPDAHIRWRDVWFGAAFTALLFAVGKFGLGMYLGRAGTTSTYGAAGSFVLILLWIYYSSLILLLGAEFTQVRAKIIGRRIRPKYYAEFMTDYGRLAQGTGSRERG
jgi:membrane protein